MARRAAGLPLYRAGCAATATIHMDLDTLKANRSALLQRTSSRAGR